ncbi:peptide-methionine (S)-S-oxide reductase MsrA [Maritalea myrionectae]|uniref:peptide-methionine (S)-S-oxide reductase MsrA n=1 Tax=Maritalea myrionectae TaxID=454601 RepID=UPI0003F6AE64|nr:peptide-methionine (S)-S-oxide reductase MsrA [Maritalea myrionectae]
MFMTKPSHIVSKSDALPGRDTPLPTAENHFVNGNPLKGPYPEGNEMLYIGMGCFWGAERLFWQLEGVWVTAVGYQGGHTPNPTYHEVCTGNTGHTEAVLINFDPSVISLDKILRTFWEEHDPTQGMRQGNDRGTQYRSAIYATGPEQLAAVERSRDDFQAQLDKAGMGKITTEIATAETFYFAEDYHQQYLAKNPGGYCGLRGTGVTCAGD